MNIADTNKSYGLITIFLHWIMAILIIGLFALGEYMVDLSYYDSWYNLALWWHDALGIIVFGLLMMRLIWKLSNTSPMPLTTYKKIEIKAAKYTHILFYILLLVICISGYFISTAKGAHIEVFNWFNVPSVIHLRESQADAAGKIHEIAVYILAALFVLHVVATFKHHFFDKDITLVRILKPMKPKESIK